MRHSKNSLDFEQLEKLLAENMTLENIAEYYNTSITTISEITSEIFSKKKLNRPVEKVGAWMESQERKALKTAIEKDEWLLLKETNLYKKLIYGRN